MEHLSLILDANEQYDCFPFSCVQEEDPTTKPVAETFDQAPSVSHFRSQGLYFEASRDMKFYAIILVIFHLAICYEDDDILNELAADLKKILEKELTLPITVQATDEELQNIEGSGEDEKKTEAITSSAPEITSSITPSTTSITSTTTTTTTQKPTTRRHPLITPKPRKPIHPIHPKFLRICQTDVACLVDSDCGQGRCFGTHLGKCNCRACVPAKNCTDDADCGGLRGACHLGECHCERALAGHGFSLMVDAVLSFCDQKTCTTDGDDCHGLPCQVGKCRCTSDHK